MDQSWRSAWRDVKSVTNRLVRGVCFEEMMSEPVEVKIPEGEGAVRVGEVEVSYGDLRILASHEVRGTTSWLNDSVLDAYFALLSWRSRLDSDLPKVYAFPTQFYKKLSKVGPKDEGLARWVKKVDLFENELLFMPFCHNLHWLLIVVDLKLRSITFIDSFGQCDAKVTEPLLAFLKEEATRRCYTLPPIEIRGMREAVPHQTNLVDCGAFVMVEGEFLSRRSRFMYRQEHMENLRKRMVRELMAGSLEEKI